VVMDPKWFEGYDLPENGDAVVCSVRTGRDGE
jgi:hypothetical protein